jgi:LysM repeat protein
MNNTNPLIPQGSFQGQAPRGRSRFMVAFYCVAAIHVVFFGGLLLVGCNGDKSKVADNATPPADTAPAPDTSTSSLPALPPMTAAPPSNPAPVVLPPPPPPAPPAPAATEYVVVKGDTMGNIAKSNHVTLKALQAANPTVVATKLQVGKKLQIPAGDGSAAVAPGNVAMVSADGGETYTVKSGDTLTKIATTHGTTIKALRAANSLKTDGIKVGQKLKIPAKAAASVVEPAPMATPSPAPMTPAAPASPAPLSPAAPVR